MARARLVATLAALTALGVGAVPAAGAVPGGDGVIAFTVAHGGAAGQNSAYRIASIQPDGTGLIELPEIDEVSDSQPAWSPDGSRIAYVRWPGEDLGSTDIWLMDADGTNRERVTRNARYDYHPAWSPDGTMLVFERIMDRSHKLWVKVLGGGAPTRITNVRAWQPDWSPDGSLIVFMRRGGDLFTVRPDGSALTRVTETPEVVESRPAWSPDGARIAFEGVARGGRTGLYVMDADGTDVVALTDTTGGFEGSPAWSPSGDRIAYIAGEPSGLWVMASDGSDPTFVSGSWLSDPAWQPIR